MRTQSYYILIFSFFIILCNSCGKINSVKLTKEVKQSNEIKYAKGFDIKHFSEYKKLIIKSPYPDATESFEYILTTIPSLHDNESSIKRIKVPVENIVVTSTTHIPMLELLGVEKSLIGFQNTNYISAEKTRKRVDSGFVRELGNEAAMNTEVLFELQPDIVIGFSMNKVNKIYSLIEKYGIPVLINGDWLEETPLGRAEWIKFFGVLFDKEKEADSIFRKIESNYLESMLLAKNAIYKPTILSGAVMRNDIWNLPAGDSFVAQFLEDANLNYLWKESKGKGSLKLSFESVFDKGQHADYWIAPGYFSTKEQLLENNTHYKNFTSFQKNKIYTASTRTGITGGVIYYELAPTRPDLVLKDIIKITNPNALPNYKLSFFEQMK
tara:strand:+ start:13188 stop:14333 length:1146 start_codon:yes stop_codon:yes gene_type:complete